MAKTQSTVGAPRSGPDLTAIVRILESTLVHLGLGSMCRSCTRAIVKELNGLWEEMGKAREEEYPFA